MSVPLLPPEDIHNHFKKYEVEYLQFAFRWMNNLLMRELPLRCTIRLWDTYQVQLSSVDAHTAADLLHGNLSMVRVLFSTGWSRGFLPLPPLCLCCFPHWVAQRNPLHGRLSGATAAFSLLTHSAKREAQDIDLSCKRKNRVKWLEKPLLTHFWIEVV